MIEILLADCLKLDKLVKLLKCFDKDSFDESAARRSKVSS